MNKKYIPFVTTSPIYKPEDIIKVLDMSVNESMLISTRNHVVPNDKHSPMIYAYNVPCAFDIEVSSFIDNTYTELINEAEYAEQQMEIQTAHRYEIEGIYQTIKEEGGINTLDLIHAMGKDRARDISRKWRGICSKKNAPLDLLADRLVDRGFMQFAVTGEAYGVGHGDPNLIIEWLENNSRKYDKIPHVKAISPKNYKRACMYVWQFGINGRVIIGRTWKELEDMFTAIVEHLHLSDDRHLVIYVHNLSYEFQFIRRHFEWDKVFAVERRTPVYAVTTSGLNFKCSYLLSGYSLAKLGDELRLYPINKMTGDLDYSLARHSQTPLTEAELKYCENDVRVVMSYIQELIETTDKSIAGIPITKTARVREYCRNCCLYSRNDHKKGISKFLNYRHLMDTLTLDVEEYKLMQSAFQGGFTHANAYYSMQTLEHIASYDITSSYPYVMVTELFPMSKGELINGTGIPNSKAQFIEYMKKYCCVFKIMLIGVRPKFTYEHYISVSKCIASEGLISDNEILPDNGRVVYADRLITVMTEIDYAIASKIYEWDNERVLDMHYYSRGYLPTDFVRAILKLYSDKTTLKGVEGKEIEYLAGKSMLNSTYGMCVTDICPDDNVYTSNHEWVEEPADYEECISKYNTSKKRFLSYIWGIYVTAYARKNLYSAILEFKEDYVYSDTDSVKVLNYERHEGYIRKYNELCRRKLMQACKYHGIPFSMVEPETIKGEKKLLGVWDFEGVYDKFKTLGAKRYLTEKNGKISLTVSGINKNSAVPYLIETYGVEGVFEAFDDNLYIPAEFTGKNTHIYIDFPIWGMLTDYTGITAPYHELSATHLEGADYSLSMPVQYIDYVRGLRTIER